MRKRLYSVLLLLAILLVPALNGCSCLDISSGNDDGHNNNENEFVEIYFEDIERRVEKNGTYQLEVCFLDENVEDKTITWRSIYENIATVDENGVVTGHNVGWAPIEATSSSGYTTTCHIEVVISPTSLELSVSEMLLFTGDEQQIQIYMQPEDTTEWDRVGWTSSNPEVANILGNNTVYAYTAGTTVLTATTINGLTATCTVVVKPYVKVTNVRFDKTGQTVVIPYDQDSTEVQLACKVYPTNASYPELSWSSSDESVATVDSNGVVTVIGEGTINITASTRDNVKSSYKIIATKEVLATRISITATMTFVEGDNPRRVGTSFTPYNTTYKTLTWSSSDESVATVDGGLVTPVGVGTAVITATTKYGLTDTCIVTVNKRIFAESITLDNTTITVEETKTETLVATILPENTTTKTVTWTSSDTSVATVSSSGVVTGVSIGETTITATTSNGLTAQCKVIVEELKVRIAVMVNGEQVDTIYTAKSKGYVATLPDKYADITTDSSLNNYFYAWFADEECTDLLDGTETYEEDGMAIYAKNIHVNYSDFTINAFNSKQANITGFSNTLQAETIVIPKYINGYEIVGINGYVITDDTVKMIIILNGVELFSRSIYGCEALEYIYIPKGGYNIKSASIYNCPNLKYNELTGISYIGTLTDPYIYAIKSVDNSANIIIPDECEQLNSVYTTMYNMVSIAVEEGNLYYSSMTGILYNKAQTEMLHIPAKLAGDIVIPSTITTIADNAFRQNTKITSIDLGGGVESIGSEAFYLCSKLASVTGTESLVTIGESAFSSCELITEFVFPETLKKIGTNALSGTQLRTVVVPDSVTSIGSGAFSGCYRITSLTLPFLGGSKKTDPSALGSSPLGSIFGTYNNNRCTAVTQYYYNSSGTKYERVYYFPSNLSTVTIKGGIVGKYAFCNISNSVQVTLGDGVTMIDENAFLNSNITTLHLPASLTEIRKQAFNVKNLDDVYYGGTVEKWCKITLVDEYSTPAKLADNFYVGDSLVTEVTIPSDLTEVKQYTLAHLRSLTKVNLHSNVVTISEGSFLGCSSLREISSLANIVEINDKAFSDCEKLQNVNMSSNLTAIGDKAFMNCKSITTMLLPDSVESIGVSAFEGCENLAEVKLPSELTAINRRTFASCYKLGNIDIPESVETISSQAFYRCESMTQLVVKSLDTYLGSGILEGCSGLQQLTISYIEEDPEPSLEIMGYLFGSTSLPNMATVSQPYYNTNRDYYMPPNLETVTVLKGTINTAMFINMKMLKKIVLCQDVTEIGVSAFATCTHLEEIVINSSSLANFSYYSGTFANVGIETTNGTKIVFGKTLQNIPDYFFSTYSTSSAKGNITQVVFEEGSTCTTIGNYAFSDLVGVSEIIVPASVTSIGEYAFRNCQVSSIGVEEDNTKFSSIDGNLYNEDGTKLIQYAVGKTNSTFEITSQISEIGQYAFSGAKNLTKVVLNTDLLADASTSSNYIFYGIDNGFEVEIGVNVTRIPAYLFRLYKDNGTNVTSLTFAEGAKCKTIGANAFDSCVNLTDISLSGSVATIEADAFLNCVNIDSVDFVGSVDELAQVSYATITANPMNYATEFTLNGEKLKNVELSDEVDVVGRYAFLNNKDIESVSMPDTVTSIGTYAFANCIGITELVIPSSVQSIAQASLIGCYNITKITVPFVGNYRNANIQYRYPFASIFGTVEYDNSYQVLPYNYSDTNSSGTKYYLPDCLVEVVVTGGEIYTGGFAYCTSIEKITIPDSLTSIESYVFYNCSSLQNINIPNAITSINEYAFNRCSSLVNVAIGDNVESIGSHAFAYCYNLKTVSLGSKVASIGEGAFVSCSRLHTVGMSQMLADIGDSAFQYCRCLRNFEFPVSLETIGEKAFYECISLLSVKIRTNVSSIGNNAFFGCEKLVEVYSCSSHINVHLDPNGYGSVGRYAEIIHTNINTPSVLEYVNNEMVFADINNVSYLLSYIDDNAETVVLPTREGGYKIYRRAFTGLGKLRSVTIPACVEELEYATFNDCHNLEYLSITSSTTSFSGHMVEECPNLEIFNYVGTMDEWLSMVFPTANYSPMHYANSFRINGETITTYTVPNKYTTINNYAFYNFDNLVSITIPSSVTKIGDGAFLDCSNLSSINIASNGLTNVGANVFAGTAISEFDIPTSLERIGDGMFADCYNLTGISIGSHIKSIGSGAFRNCNFKEVVMPSSVQYVGDGAFAGCAMLERLVISQLLSYTGVVVNNVVLGHIFGTTVQNTKQFAPVVQSYDQDNSSTYYIPLSLQEVTVLGGEIAYGAFDNCGWFDVTLGSGITAISDNAFDLDAPYVTLEGGVYYVGNWVIASNSSITSVTLKEGVVGIAKSAFRNSVITSVSTLDNVKHIGDYAFANSNKLRSISLGGSVLSIGESAFYGCTALTSVTIPSSVKSIGNRAFGACTKLAEISVDSGNTVYSSTDGNLYSNRGQTLIQYAIGKTATSFTLPTDVKVIGAYAFEDSTLTTVYIGSNLKAIEEYAFYYCTQLKSIALPDSCESIGEYAFFYCSRLQSVAFGSALELIEANAFKYCSQLEEASFKYSTDWVIETNPETSIAGEDTMDSATMADTLRTYSGYVFRKKD